METYEQFKQRNINFEGNYYFFEKGMMEDVMKRNYSIACEVEKTYNETFGNTDGPRIGDIVEFSDGFSVYDHAKIVENLYGGSAFGVLCVCENGSSFTDGRNFSTSGGSFVRRHKSRLQYVGEEENIVWTWGCHGAGANHGIYFPLKVRKWIIPYDPIQKASKVYIRKDNRYPVKIENFGSFGGGECFSSVKAFRAWADYVGFVNKPFNGTFERVSPQRITRKYILEEKDIPANGKPLKLIDNGEVREAWAVTTETAITYTLFNINVKRDSDDKEDRLQDYRKYAGNPLGV